RELRLHACQLFGDEIEVEVVVEQVVVPHHAAHREGSDEGLGVLLDGDTGDVPAHRVPGEVCPPGIADQAIEELTERVRILDALLHVVAVRGEAGRPPRIAVRHQELANARVGDGELEPRPPEAVRVQDEFAVPFGRDLDAVAGAAVDTPVTRRGGARDRVRRQLGLVAAVGGGSASRGRWPWPRRGGGGARAATTPLTTRTATSSAVMTVMNPCLVMDRLLLGLVREPRYQGRRPLAANVPLGHCADPNTLRMKTESSEKLGRPGNPRACSRPPQSDISTGMYPSTSQYPPAHDPALRADPPGCAHRCGESLGSQILVNHEGRAEDVGNDIFTPWVTTLAAVYLGLFPTVLAYVAWSYVLTHLPAPRASVYAYLVPPLSTCIALAWVNEVPRLSLLIGGAGFSADSQSAQTRPDDGVRCQTPMPGAQEPTAQ